MTGGRLIKEARRRAGLSQAELARRLRTSQSVVARWENGVRSPSLETVLRAVRACGLDLHLSLAAYDSDHDRLIEDRLELEPGERLEALLEGIHAEERLRRARRVG